MTKTRVLFLGGLGRSGTTLIERVLGELPGVCSAGEVVHLWRWGILDDERCGCGEPFGRCPFWTEVGRRGFGAAGFDPVLARRMLGLRARVDRARYLPQLMVPTRMHPRARDLDSYLRGYGAVYTAAAQTAGAAVVVDSSKHSSLAYCLRHHRGLDVRVVHVVRDSRGVAYSWTKQMARPEAAQGREVMTRYSPLRSALLWNANNASLAMLERLGTPRLVVRYEDFVTDPGAVVRRIAEFADLPLAPDALDHVGADHVELTSAHTVAGNPMRFRTGRIDLRSDDAWRERLPRRQRRMISALTAPLLHRYGYPLGVNA
ncbi:MAG: sulfotransferase [Geodermatophilaceae bacterium]